MKINANFFKKNAPAPVKEKDKEYETETVNTLKKTASPRKLHQIKDPSPVKKDAHSIAKAKAKAKPAPRKTPAKNSSEDRQLASAGFKSELQFKPFMNFVKVVYTGLNPRSKFHPLALEILKDEYEKFTILLLNMALKLCNHRDKLTVTEKDFEKMVELFGYASTPDSV